MPEIPFNWVWQGQQRQKTVRMNVPAGATPDVPVIVLLHGTSGNINDMADPGVHPGLNHERFAEGTIRDRGWHAYPNVGWWAIGVDALAPVVGWEPYLNGRGLPTLNYSQAAERGALVESAMELRRLLEALDSDPAFSALAGRRIVLVGHSRGGILARQVLVDLRAAGSSVLSRISKCITLHAPNQGSMLADVAIAVDLAAVNWRAANPDPTIDALLAMIHDEASALAYRDYFVGAPTLIAIAASEPVPGVEYFTFGGTRPVLFNVRAWAFTAESAVPQFHDPPFHWTTAYKTILTIPGFVPGLLELTPGAGDVLVAASRARLPFSVHRDNQLNHAECLWDPTLKNQVAEILDREPLPALVGKQPEPQLQPEPWLQQTEAQEPPASQLQQTSGSSQPSSDCLYYHAPPWWVAFPPWWVTYPSPLTKTKTAERS